MSSQKIDRRSVLAFSAAGGAALAGNLFGIDLRAIELQSAPAGMPGGRMRRIVTGHNAEGKSYIASDEVVDVASIWTTKADQPIGAPPAGEPRQLTHVTGETRLFVATIQPHRDPKPNLTNRIGFHRTPGVAYCYMLNGEITFLVDTQEVKIKAGDMVIERNTMHSWRNEGPAPLSMLITVVNAA